MKNHAQGIKKELGSRKEVQLNEGLKASLVGVTAVGSVTQATSPANTPREWEPAITSRE